MLSLIVITYTFGYALGYKEESTSDYFLRKTNEDKILDHLYKVKAQKAKNNAEIKKENIDL